MSLVMSDTGGFGPRVPSATGGMPAELPVDLSVLYNTMAVIALSVTRLFNRLSSPSTPLYSDLHGLRKLVRSSSSTGHDTKTGLNSDSLTGAWRKMLLLDGVEVDHSTRPALQSSTAALPQRACKLGSQIGKVTSGKSELLCLQMDGISCTDTDSLPTSPLHSPARGRSCSPRPRPSSTWVTLPCPEPHHAAMDANSSSTPPQSHLIGFEACMLHNHSELSKASLSVHTAAVGPGPVSNTTQPADFALACADSVCLVGVNSPTVPTTIDSTALPASVLSEVRSMLRAMGAYPLKGIVLPSSATAHQCSSIPTAPICGSTSSTPLLPLYNASLSSQLGSGTAVGRGGFGSVFSSVWGGEDVAIKRVPFNATSAQRSVQQGPQPSTIASGLAKVPSSWRLPNGILLECAHAIVLGGGCSSVCFEGIVQLRCWSISPLPPSLDLDTNTHELLLAMPLLRHSLEQALQQHLPLKDALAAANDVASAASSLHRRNVVHGDLKCANAMQASDGAWLLVDFGLAATLKGNMRSAAARGSSQGHAAPELLRDGRITTATDVFAAGVMLHRVLTHKSVMRGAPAWWTTAVTAAGSTASINETLGNKQAGQVHFLTGAHTGSVNTTAGGQLCAMVHLLQQLQQAQLECPSARPTMQQLCDAIQGAADCVQVLLTRSHASGFGPYGPDFLSEEDEHAADRCRGGAGQGPDGCSSSPTFSTITTDPAWSSSSRIDSEADDMDAEEGTTPVEGLSSSETAESSGG